MFLTAADFFMLDIYGELKFIDLTCGSNSVGRVIHTD